MPQNDPRASISNAPRRPVPADILFYQNASLLDTIFIRKPKKEPAWITITAGSQTTLYSVSTSGKLTSAGMIEWASKGEGSKKSTVTVKIGEETFPADAFGRPSGGFYGSTSSRRFTIDDLNCQWACATLETKSPSGSFAGQFDSVLQWDCTAEIPGSPPNSPQPTSSASKFLTFFKPSPPENPRTLLASYLDGTERSQRLSIYPEGVPYTPQLMISAILSNSESGLWKKQQSNASAVEVEATLSADLGGELPTYTPVRPTSSTRTMLHPSVTIRRPSRWTDPRPRTTLPTTPDDSPPEYASTSRPSTQ